MYIMSTFFLSKNNIIYPFWPHMAIKKPNREKIPVLVFLGSYIIYIYIYEDSKAKIRNLQRFWGLLRSENQKQNKSCIAIQLCTLLMYQFECFLYLKSTENPNLTKSLQILDFCFGPFIYIYIIYYIRQR